MTGHCWPLTVDLVGRMPPGVSEVFRIAHIGLLAGVLSVSLSGFMPGVWPQNVARGPSCSKMP